MKNMRKDRDQTLDIAKGLLIVFVVLGHAIQYSFGAEYTDSRLFFDNIVFKSIYTFHMPLFMLISGYLFYYSNKKNYKDVAISKIKATGIPMLTFVILCNVPIYIPLQGNIWETLLSFGKLIVANMIGLGGTMWFLFSILLNVVIVSTITRITQTRSMQYVLMALLCVACLFIPDSIMSRAYKFMIPFFCIGYITKENELPIYSATNNKIVMAILTSLSIGAIWWFDRDTYIYTSGFCIIGNYINQLLIDIKRFVIALVVSYTFMQYVRLLLSTKDNALSMVCSKLGQMSLFVYGFNVLFDTIYIKFVAYYNINFSFNYLIPIVFTIIVVVLAAVLYKLLQRNRVASLLLLGK